jgi:aspartate/tyrosine/aromatic aminotransferase
MFCYTGLTPDQIETLEKKHHIFMAADGRASVIGINTKSVDHIAKSFYEVAH